MFYPNPEQFKDSELLNSEVLKRWAILQQKVKGFTSVNAIFYACAKSESSIPY